MSTSYGPGPLRRRLRDRRPRLSVRLRAMDAEPEHAVVSRPRGTRPDRRAAAHRSRDLRGRSAGRVSRAGGRDDGELPLGVLIRYPDDTRELPEPADSTRVVIRGHRKAPAGPLNYALVGAGAFGTAMLVPQMKKRRDRFFLKAVVSRNASQGGNFARDNQVEILTSDLGDVLKRSRHRPRRHRDAPSRARRPGRARARGRQARLRREAAGAHVGRARSCRDRLPRPRVAADADGRIQPPVFAGADGGQGARSPKRRAPLVDRIPAERRLHPARSLGARRAGRRTQHRRGVPHVRRVPVPDRLAGRVDCGRPRSIRARCRTAATTTSARRSATRTAASRTCSTRRSARRRAWARSGSRSSATARPTSSTTSSG